VRRVRIEVCLKDCGTRDEGEIHDLVTKLLREEVAERIHEELAWELQFRGLDIKLNGNGLTMTVVPATREEPEED